MTTREERVKRLADVEEYRLRKIVATDPNPIYTDMKDYCDVCLGSFNRLNIRIVDDFKNLDDDGIRACAECIKRYELKVLSNRKALEYEAMTEAIRRIIRGTQIIIDEKAEIFKNASKNGH